MARPRKAARIVEWARAGKPDQFFIFWTDWSSGAPTERRVNCAAKGATTERERRSLLAIYLERELAGRVSVEVEDLKGKGPTAFETPLGDVLVLYKRHVEGEAAARLASTDRSVGMAQASAAEAIASLVLFGKYLAAEGVPFLPVGQLDQQHGRGFVRWLATTASATGRRRRAATIGKHCRHMKAALHWVDSLRRPRYLPDCAHVVAGLKPPRTPPPMPQAIPPAVLGTFLVAALEHDTRGKVKVRRTKRATGKVEEYEQAVHKADTPVSRVFVLLALLGCRLGEALELRWDDVDLERGVVTLRAQKTSAVRRVPLRDEIQGAVAPELIPLLEQWRREAGARAWVLPTRSGDPPSYSRQAWRQLEVALGAKLNPQRLRRSWVSFACACGLSPPFAAMLAGHSAAVAEKWYRGVVLDRAPGKSMASAMGLAPLLDHIRRAGSVSAC